MSREVEKYSIDWVLSVVAPGSIILLFILWGFGLYYPASAELLQKHEFFSIAIFLLFSFIIGIIADNISGQIEYRRYVAEKKQPRQIVIEKNRHWLDDLDEFYSGVTGIHLYDWDKKTNLPKEGPFNGKKVDWYNLSQFEHFAGFILSEGNHQSGLDTDKNKYLLCRNLTYAFRFCALLGLVYSLTSLWPLAAKANEEIIFYNKTFCIVISATLLFVSFYLSYSYKNFRIAYVTRLYRMTRYHYLMHIKPKNADYEREKQHTPPV
jgi:hypothetical protein